MEEYHNTSYRISRLVTNSYSTSFSLGIRVFEKKYRNAIYSIYGYVRLADEIVDSFHGFDRAKLLEKFRIDTFEAINDGISANPVIHAFQEVVRQYKIDHQYICAFLDSMEMDLTNTYYKKKVYDQYIFGSAETVGLMCLYVFCNGENALFRSLLTPAKKLGSAFQKVNFLRDIKSDLDERARIYLPDVDSAEGITDNSKRILEKEVEEEFREALLGIARLPRGVRLGVYTAYLYYYFLFRKIKKLSVRDLLKERVRIPDGIKLLLLAKSIVTIKFLKPEYDEAA